MKIDRSYDRSLIDVERKEIWFTCILYNDQNGDAILYLLTVQSNSCVIMVDLLYISSLGAFIHALLSRAYLCVS